MLAVISGPVEYSIPQYFSIFHVSDLETALKLCRFRCINSPQTTYFPSNRFEAEITESFPAIVAQLYSGSAYSVVGC
jgi:hypothetical protein